MAQANAMAACRGPWAAFVRREDGTVTIFGVVVFILMVWVGGIAIDVMRYEAQRSQLQETLDRSVLAAAAITQPLTPEDVVLDYFDRSVVDDYRLRVEVEEALNYRSVSALSEADLDTMFMRMFNIHTLTTPAAGRAEETRVNVEVSLVLDISGSFSDGTKMQQLRDASIEFITTLLDEPEDALDGEDDEVPGETYVNIVPYTMGVNLGPLWDYYTFDERSPLSRCALFRTPAAFHTPQSGSTRRIAPDRGTVLDQLPHVQRYGSVRPADRAPDSDDIDGDGDRDELIDVYYPDVNYLLNPECPYESFEAIMPFSQDVAGMSGNIQQFEPRNGTGIQDGVLWGGTLLDPAIRDIVGEMVDDGLVSPDLAEFPTDWDDPDSIKFLVLMTDGNIDGIRHIEDDLYDTAEEVLHWGHTTTNGNNGILRRPDVEADQIVLDICAALRANGVIIYAVAFDVDEHSPGAQLMRGCASAPAHYFAVEEDRLGETFTAIANSINWLRLVQ